jgi:hypothetical protein
MIAHLLRALAVALQLGVDVLAAERRDGLLGRAQRRLPPRLA